MIRTVLLATAALLIAAPVQAAGGAPIVPAPASDIPREGAFQLTGATVISVPAGDAQAQASARYLADLISRSRGLKLAVRPAKPGERAIVLARGGPAGEGYRLEVTPQALTISSAGDAGLFYGAVTAWQLATATDGKGPVAIPARVIDDAPRFGWRGLMLDSARHFQSVDYVKGLIDRMALSKFNTLHWHLTDDQGWRLEIKKYPRLTEIGAWRVPAGAAPLADIDINTGKPRQIGGYYTQHQVRDIVAYAAARHITIVPEIETPGHAHAPIVAYPQLGSAATPPTATSSDWGVFPYLYNVDEGTFAFLDDVLTEVAALFPSRYIHVGGDEAVKDQWKTNPAVQARMKELHIASETAMQGWFISRIEQILKAKGRRLIGWDEILEGGVAEDATVMSWRGVDGAIVAAKLGHDTILSPAPTLYLNHRQSASPSELPGRGQVVSLKEVYDYDPMPAALNPDERHHVLGVQGNLWTEHVRTEDRASKMYFPRASALAETAWSPAGRKGWSDFTDRLPTELARQRALGLTYDESQLSVHALGSPQGAGARVTLTGGEGLGEIRYTTDGSAPGAASPVYSTPIETPVGATVRAQVFHGAAPLAAPTTFVADARNIRSRVSQELTSCTQSIELNLEDDGPVRGERARYLVDIMNPCWIYKGADLTGVSQIEVAVGQLPFNFQIGADIEKIKFRRPATPEGELEVRQDSCERARYLVDIMNPCWIYKGADLTGVSQIEVAVGQLPFNFQIGADIEKIKFRPPATPEGELEVRQGSCEGALVATLPLAPAVANNGVTVLRGPIAGAAGAKDLCFTFTQKAVEPMWVVDRVTLLAGAANGR